MFKKYMHVQKLGNREVLNITDGDVYVFPKIDGTNASVWLEDGELQAGSRNRHLSLDNDNAGFLHAVVDDPFIKDYLAAHPTHHLYGEWLVPHTLKTYRDDCWRKFYVFDVMDTTTGLMISFESYRDGLLHHGLNFIAPLCMITNPTKDQLYEQLERNTAYIKDDEGFGEGVVLKNYEHLADGQNLFAKIVRSEFLDKHRKGERVQRVEGRDLVERAIVNKFCTSAMILKVYAKIDVAEGGWTSKFIPRLLNSVFYDLVNEETWNFIKKFKNPTVDFKLLQRLVNDKVKETLPVIF